MAKFRQKPSSRRQARPTASWLVTGTTIASQIQYGRQTTYMLPVKPNHHRRRFHAGQRLSLKAFVGGSTLAHVVVSSAERIQLGDVDYSLVRELGHIRLDSFQEAWVAEHDPAFEGEALERFQARHAHREVWVIRFALDRTDSGGLMAAKSEEGYTDCAARAVSEEMPAVRGWQWEQHIGKPAREREARRQAMVADDRVAQPMDQRANAARAAARMKGVDLAREFRVYDRLKANGTLGRALTQLELIESRVFPQSQAA